MHVALLLIISLFGVGNVDCSQCACATTNVNVRNATGITHTILTILITGHCLNFKGHRKAVSGASWINVDYHGQDGWIHERYVSISACGSSSTHNSLQLPGCPNIITRVEWGARPPSSAHEKLHLPVKYIFIHHSASGFCYTKTDCMQKVNMYQNYHMDGLGWSDIGYNFVVGEDGNVYEARGWNAVGAHTYGYNSKGLDICVIGDFTDSLPNDAALKAIKQLLSCGIANEKISSSYQLRGHRDVGQTTCPGDKFYNLITTWSRYYTGV